MRDTETTTLVEQRQTPRSKALNAYFHNGIGATHENDPATVAIQVRWS
jgi:hypothetical protein